jgi:hypothetical protein
LTCKAELPLLGSVDHQLVLYALDLLLLDLRHKLRGAQRACGLGILVFRELDDAVLGHLLRGFLRVMGSDLEVLAGLSLLLYNSQSGPC